MSDQDALLAAVRQAPDDDAPRLVYADWLDEHRDPDRAAFIRLQVEIEPYRRPDSDLDRWRRAVIEAHLDDPVPTDFPPELHRYAELHRREWALRKAHQWEWLGPLGRVEDDYGAHLDVTFRRGFAEEVELAASAFLEFGDDVRDACPLLRRLTLFGVRDQMHDLAGMPALGGVRDLVLADWLSRFDASALVPSLPLRDVQSLTLWVGSHRHDDEVVRTLASKPWEGGPGRPLEGPHLPALRQVVLVQMHGGLSADDTHGRLDRRADELAGEFNRLLGRPVARVERPFARRFPLAGQVGYGLLAGHIRGQPVIVCGGRRPVVLGFAPAGRLATEDLLDLDDRLRRPPPYAGGDYNEADLIAVLRRDHGFEPGPVFVREFTSEAADLSIRPWDTYEDVVEQPDAGTDGDDHEEACYSLAHYWMGAGNFVIRYGSDYWAGPDGVIFAS